MDCVKSFFRPELLNRLDEIILFENLLPEDMHKIVSIQINELVGRIKDRNISLMLEPSAQNWLAKKGFDSVYGARPLKRLMQQQIYDKIAEGMLSGQIPDGSNLTVCLKGNTLLVDSIGLQS